MRSFSDTRYQMEKELDNKDQLIEEQALDLDIPERSNMPAQGAVRFNKSVILGIILVLFILCVYTLHYSPNAKHSAAEKEHSDWLRQMNRDRSLMNDTVEKKNSTQLPFGKNSADQSRVSMVLPADIPEDIHRPRTMEIPQRYISEKDNDTGAARTKISMVLPNTDSIPNKPEANVLADGDDDNDDNDDADDNDKDDYDYDKQSDEKNDKTTTTSAPALKISTNTQPKTGQIQQGNTQIGQPQHADALYKAEQTQQGNAQTETGQIQQGNTQIEQPQHADAQYKAEQTQQGNAHTETGQMQQGNGQLEQPQHVDSQYKIEQTQQGNSQTETERTQQGNSQIGTGEKQESVTHIQPGVAEHVRPPTSIPDQSVPAQTVQMTQERVGIAQSNVAENIIPTARPEFIRDGDDSSYKNKLNSNIDNPSQYETQKPNIYGSVLSETNRRLLDGNSQAGVLPAYQNQNEGLDKNMIPQHLDNVRNNVDEQNKERLTLPTLESRMKLHKALQDMDDIVNYGSAASDDDNKKGWKWNENENENENEDHLYDINDKRNKFANLIMQVRKNAEPVTGTKPMRPQYKSNIEYPAYLTPVDWKSSFEHVKAPIFECVPMRTLYYYIRVCIHPPAVKSEVSASLKAEASWEYDALRDMQIALSDYKDSILIDIGASFGVFSLAAAALNRNVIAVEPYPSHIQVFKQSVLLNQFTGHITLFQAVVSDHRGKVLIKRLGDHVDNVYIQTVEDNEPSTNYSLVVNAVSLDDIEKVCPSRMAVLKIDVPGFVKRVLEYSHYFFKYIYVTHVFMHWDTSDKELCHFLVRFFVERGYQPYSDLRSKSSQLKIEEADFWKNNIVIWKL